MARSFEDGTSRDCSTIVSRLGKRVLGRADDSTSPNVQTGLADENVVTKQYGVLVKKANWHGMLDKLVHWQPASHTMELSTLLQRHRKKLSQTPA